MWRKVIIGIVAIAAMLLVAFLFLREPAAKAGENGTFANDCCGTLQLSDGKMLLNDQRSISYTVGRDADGPYILPRTEVATLPGHGFAVDGTRTIHKLRLDRLPAPTSIILYEGLTPYVFKRKAPRRRM